MSSKRNLRAFVVSIHDVHPLTWRRVEAMLVDLEAWGVHKCSLLVVPDFHGKAPIQQYPDFLEWLREKAKMGYEIVLHGFTHAREEKSGEGFLDKMITRQYTAGEGEFYDIGEYAAMEKLTRGLGILRAAGLKPEGFIAPAWLLSAEGERAARAVGFQYTTRLGSVIHLPVRSRGFRAQSLVYSARSAWRVMASLWWNARLFSRLKNNPLIRLGLHPPDMEHPKIWQQIRDITREALDERMVLTYGEWIRDYFRQ